MRASPGSKRMTRRSPASWQVIVFLVASVSSLEGLCSQPVLISASAATNQARSSRLGFARAAFFACRSCDCGFIGRCLAQHLAKLRRTIPPAGLRRRYESAKVEGLLGERGGEALQGLVRQGWFARQDAPVTQRRVRRRKPAVLGVERDDDRLAAERIPPDAQGTHRSDLEYRRQRRLERARAAFIGFRRAIGPQT